LRLDLEPFVTDLGVCVIRKEEIMELTLPDHVTSTRKISETQKCENV